MLRKCSDWVDLLRFGLAETTEVHEVARKSAQLFISVEMLRNHPPLGA
jgi:hypothetical protein